MVKDDAGVPVDGATVELVGTTGEPWGPSNNDGVSHTAMFITGADGSAEGGLITDVFATISASKLNYYSSLGSVDDAALRNQDASDPITIVLKRVISPRPLVAKRAYVILPNPSGRAAYDFIAGDLVAPFGKGISADCVLLWSQSPDSKERGQYDIQFTNPNCGIMAQRVSLPESDLRSERTAPADGYVHSMRESESVAGYGNRGAWRNGGIIYYLHFLHSGAYLFGKILGEPEIIFYDRQSKPVLQFSYAVNPKGDASLEPDFHSILLPRANGYEGPYLLPEQD
jgi:hypothetical protein